MSKAIVLKDPHDVRAACDDARSNTKRVGFVPTMGALHEGHLALVRAARAEERANFVVCSIFVNPTQFGPSEDLAQYPRDLEGDVKKLESVGVDVVFAPSANAMYVPGERTRVRVDELTAHLCGPHRPGHFEGVTTIVAKLFAIVGPCVAVFGKKDFQQLAVLRRMTRDLFFPVEIVGQPIIREKDGLAMSSRNAYLSTEDRVRALALSQGLARAAHAFEKGERRAGTLRSLVDDMIRSVATSIDYVTIADVETLQPLDENATTPDRALIAVACRIGKTRLIDNVVLGEDPPPSG